MTRAAPIFLACVVFIASPLFAQRGSPQDLYGDPLPSGATARLGTLRFRQQDTTSGVTFVPGDKKLAVLTYEGELIHYNLDTGNQTARSKIAEGYVRSFAATPDGKRLAFGIMR